MRLVGADRYRLSTAALVIGLGGGWLMAQHGSFAYTGALRHAIGMRALPVFPLLLVAAALAGMFVSAGLRRSFRWRVDGTATWARRFAGGVLMGAGGTLIPGGNSVLVLSGIPSLSPHALPAYGSMLVAVALVLSIARPRLRVRCTGDVCTTSGRSS